MAVSWSPAELQKHIDEILHAERLVSIEHDSKLMHFLFKYPTRKALQLADIVHDNTMAKAKRDKFKTEDEMMQFILDNKIWTQEDEEKSEEIRSKIRKWKEKIENPDISDQSKEYAKELVNKLEEDLWRLELKKERMMLHTAERQARQEKYDYLLWYCSFDPISNNRIAENNLTFYEMIEGGLRNSILTKFLEYLAGHSTEEIRYIARNSLWRVNYISATKANMPLFPNSVIELTPDQLNLIWWSSYYQSIYEMMPEDQPEHWVIEDDELLDKHMEELHKERSKETQSKREEKKYGTRTAMKMQEALVFRSHPDYERLQYDEVPATSVKGDKANTDLKDDIRMRGARRKKSKEISKSRRYSKKPKN